MRFEANLRFEDTSMSLISFQLRGCNRNSVFGGRGRVRFGDVPRSRENFLFKKLFARLIISYTRMTPSSDLLFMLPGYVPRQIPTPPLL